MPDKRCCAECINDKYLRDQIQFQFNSDDGTCDYCGEHVTTLVAPSSLRDYFETLVSMYEPDEDGQTLPAVLRNDWHGLFAGPVMSDDAAAQTLLSDVLDDADRAQRLYSPSTAAIVPGLTRWDELRNEMMHGNRWFLKESIDFKRLEGHLQYLIVDAATLSTEWYRARVVEDGPIALEMMGAPPEKNATHGRANPPGIRYLYVGSSVETAVNEIRPHTGDTACVATFTVTDLKVVDLRAPRTMISPFPFALDDDQLKQIYADMPVLVRLGEELTRPVNRRGSAFEYAPSQYLCEFIKHCGYDGVLYDSSVSDGINLALFRPDDATAVECHEYSVDKVVVKVSSLVLVGGA